MANIKYLQCVQCGQRYKPMPDATTCKKCGEILNVVYDYDKIFDGINLTHILARKGWKYGIWKYKELLPVIAEKNMLSLGEGETPLLECKNLRKRLATNSNIYIKNLAMNPTGSLKDASAAITIAKALEAGASKIIVVSSGNEASSLAAYSSIARLKAYALVPPDIPPAKIAQILLYGGTVVKVRGSHLELTRLLEEVCGEDDLYNADQPLNPYGVEGYKTYAYEECEQLNWSVPDWVIVPIGSASNLVGHWKGYKEFHKLGAIKSIPKFAAIQPENAAPFVRAFEHHKKKAEAVSPGETVAGGLVTEIPLNSIRGLEVIRETGGTAQTVSDEEILEAEKLLAQEEGVFAEPSAAAALAGFKKLLNSGSIKRNASVILVITGTGLKDLDSALHICEHGVVEIGLRAEELNAIINRNS